MPDDVGPLPAVVEIEEALAKRPFEVLVLGNSKARTDQDAGKLGKLLSQPDALVRATAIKVDASYACTWYAVLKNRVYQNPEYRPKLVVILSTMTAMVGSTPRTEQDRLRLMEQLGEDEPVIAKKSFGADSVGGPIERAREQRTRLRSELLDGVRDMALSLVFGKDGKMLASNALPVVFGEEAMLSAGQHRAIPIAETEVVQVARQDVAAQDFIQQTFLPDLIDLAQSQGAKIVFVRSPLAPSNQDGDELAPELERAIVDYFNQRQAGYLDLRTLGLQDVDFRDSIHLNNKGREVFTVALARGLQGLNALGVGAVSKAALPLVPARIVRVGPLPILEQPKKISRMDDSPCGFVLPIPDLADLADSNTATLGLGTSSPVVLLEDGKPLKPHAKRSEFADQCGGSFIHQRLALRFSPTDAAENARLERYQVGLSEDFPIDSGDGEVYWLYPGTSMAVDFEGEWGDRGEWEVVADLVGFGEGPFVLEANGQRVEFQERSAGSWSAMLSGPAPVGGWGIQVHAPPGSYAVVSHLKVGKDSSGLYVVGQAPGAVRLLDGKIEDVQAMAVQSSLDRQYSGSGEGLLRVEGFELLADTVWGSRVDRGRCSPLRVLEDEKMLPLHNRGRTDVTGPDAQPGTVAHEREGLLFRPLLGEVSSHRYTVERLSDRRCGSYRWVYPGDSFGLRIPPAMMRVVGRGVDRLILSGLLPSDTSIPPEQVVLRVRLEVDEAVVLDQPVTAAELDGTLREWQLPVRVLQRAKVQLLLSSPENAPYILLTQGLLTEASLSSEPSTP